MAQAKVLSEQEFKRALAVVAKRRHHARDRLALLLTHWAGMRVCEVAALTYTLTMLILDPDLLIFAVNLSLYQCLRHSQLIIKFFDQFNPTMIRFRLNVLLGNSNKLEFTQMLHNNFPHLWAQCPLTELCCFLMEPNSYRKVVEIQKLIEKVIS